jgi:signal transduction histidine kinase
MDRQAENHLRRLVEHGAKYGQEALEGEIRWMLQDGVNTDTEILMLTDAQGHVLLGNAAPWPPRRLSTVGVRDVKVRRAGALVAGRVAVAELPDGRLLAVGSDLQAQRHMEELIGRASLMAAFIALVMAVVGALVFRRVVDDRAADIRSTMARVAAGDLRQRIPVAGRDDEFTLLGRDINGMLDRLEHLMEGIRHVSNTIAHNLRTPLTRMLLQLRGAEQAPAAEQAATLARVAREVEELGVVFDKLLQIAEVESGTSRTRFARVEVRDLLLDVADLYAPVLEDSGGSLRAQVQDAPAALGDADLLASAIANLIDNAIKYGRAPEGGRGADIVLHAAPAQGPGGAPGIAITVRDHGPGVEPQALEQLGTRFFRARTDGQGYGLGLSSVRAIVELHGGRLEFANTHPGMQARIWLPAPPPA